MRKIILFITAAAMLTAVGCNKKSETTSVTESTLKKLETQKLSTFGLDVQKVDMNNDGKPDQTIYTKDGVLQYAVRDFNFDGVKDMTEFYENGVHVRDEIDLDYDGICDVIVTYQNGLPVKKEFSIDFEGNRHGTQYFNSEGKRTEIHRDTNNNGVEDTIEYYNPDEDTPYKTEKIQENL